ncbi:hypothetical protein PGB90_008959 [Kerria lacca]
MSEIEMENKNAAKTKTQISNRSILYDLSCSNDMSNISLNKGVNDNVTIEIKKLYIFGLITSIILHILDVGTDIYLAFQYYQYNEMNYFILTVSFIIFPAFINTMISTRMYIMESESVCWQKWLIRGFVLTFLCAPIIRYVETLQYALKLRSNKYGRSVKFEKYYKPLLREDSNLSLLRIIECFLEAAPQQVLQIAILLDLRRRGINSFLQIYQFMTIFTSLVSIAWSFVIYNRSVRFAREDKRKMSWIGSFMQFSWLFLVTTSRILAISEAASVYPKITFAACIVHWFIMTMWLSIYERTWFCRSSTSSSKSKNNVKNSLEISVCFVENTVAILLWSVWGKPESTEFWWFVPLLIGLISKSKYESSHSVEKLDDLNEDEDEDEDRMSEEVQTND